MPRLSHRRGRPPFHRPGPPLVHALISCVLFARAAVVGADRGDRIHLRLHAPTRCVGHIGHLARIHRGLSPDSRVRRYGVQLARSVYNLPRFHTLQQE